MTERTQERIRQAEEKIEREYQRHHEMFLRYVEPALETPIPRVLSVGCSFAQEANGLFRAFPGATYLGIDIDRTLFRRGVFVPDVYLKGLESIEIREQNVHDQQLEEEEPWDLVIIRHIDAMSGTSTPILDRSVELLREGGVLFVTTWYAYEAGAVRIDLENNPNVQIVISERNKGNVEAFGNDKFVAVGKKVSKAK